MENYKYNKLPLDISKKELEKNYGLCEKIDFLILNVIDEDNLSFMKVKEIEDLFEEYKNSNKLFESQDFDEEDFDEEDFDENFLKIEKTNYDIQSINVKYNNELFVIYFVPNFKRPYKLNNSNFKIPNLYDNNGDYWNESGFYIFIDKLNYLFYENNLFDDNWNEEELNYINLASEIINYFKENKSKYFKN
jgi:hypothetical protein